MMNLSTLIALAPLMSKKLEELTLDDLSLVQKTVGIEIELNAELVQAGVALLQGENIHSVADLVKSPAAIQQLIQFFHGGMSALAPVSQVIGGEGWQLKVEDLQL